MAEEKKYSQDQVEEIVKRAIEDALTLNGKEEKKTEETEEEKKKREDREKRKKELEDELKKLKDEEKNEKKGQKEEKKEKKESFWKLTMSWLWGGVKIIGPLGCLSSVFGIASVIIVFLLLSTVSSGLGFREMMSLPGVLLKTFLKGMVLGGIICFLWKNSWKLILTSIPVSVIVAVLRLGSINPKKLTSAQMICIPPMLFDTFFWTILIFTFIGYLLGKKRKKEKKIKQEKKLDELLNP
ncbi:hypothetical protein KJ855_01090 [Patescibacteria group bacterium]|nr:hypothetical protein [Patescibacteria group bacterium]